VLDAEVRLKKAEEEEAVQKLITELERGGLATSGLRDTIHRLNLFEVQSLVVTHNFARPGRICPTHKFLYLDELKCPVDDKKTDPVQDIIDEAIETVLKRGERSSRSSRRPSSTATAASAPSSSTRPSAAQKRGGPRSGTRPCRSWRWPRAPRLQPAFYP